MIEVPVVKENYAKEYPLCNGMLVRYSGSRAPDIRLPQMQGSVYFAYWI